jgi:hypothetical protein
LPEPIGVIIPQELEQMDSNNKKEKKLDRQQIIDKMRDLEREAVALNAYGDAFRELEKY